MLKSGIRKIKVGGESRTLKNTLESAACGSNQMAWERSKVLANVDFYEAFIYNKISLKK